MVLEDLIEITEEYGLDHRTTITMTFKMAMQHTIASKSLAESNFDIEKTTKDMMLENIRRHLTEILLKEFYQHSTPNHSLMGMDILMHCVDGFKDDDPLVIMIHPKRMAEIMERGDGIRWPMETIPTVNLECPRCHKKVGRIVQGYKDGIKSRLWFCYNCVNYVPVEDTIKCIPKV